jgi:predicted ABC-type ATPase
MEAKIHKPVLIVIAGPNGSGKTTITSRVLHHEWLEDSIYINPDNIAQNMFGDWNNQDAVLKASQYADRTYVYDNSKDGVEAQLLFRMTEGKIFKEYVKEIPEWAIGIANKEG